MCGRYTQHLGKKKTKETGALYRTNVKKMKNRNREECAGHSKLIYLGVRLKS